MENVITEKQVGEFTIRTFYEESPESPREWDNLGTMVCFHKRYNLGDKHNYKHNDYSGWDDMKKAIIKNENVGVILPLYLYDHSGITIATNPFSCPWDSGQVGFIYASKKNMLEGYGGKIVTKKVKERVINYLEGEVKTYDQYLKGEIYGVGVFKNDELVHSCFGFYSEEEAIEDGMGYVD